MRGIFVSTGFQIFAATIIFALLVNGAFPNPVAVAGTPVTRRAHFTRRRGRLWPSWPHLFGVAAFTATVLARSEAGAMSKETPVRRDKTSGTAHNEMAARGSVY
jgi:hypothetical protein